MPEQLPTWITITRATAPCWRAVRVEYIDPLDPRNNGSVNTYIKTLTENGEWAAGVKVWQDWKDDRASENTKLQVQAPDFNGEKFGTTFFMSGDSSFDPNKGQVGVYSFYVDGNSDKVNGLGLPLKRHVQYLITFQWVNETPIPPIPTGRWVIASQTETEIVLNRIP